MNRVRFKGRVGRKTLEPGTYALTAHAAGRTQRTGRIVVVIGRAARERLECSSSTGSALFGAGSFADGLGGSSSGAAVDTETAPAGDKTGGVLPAITKKLRELPRALPKPPLPSNPSSPPTLLGLIALGLLALSGFAILAYVIRFVRRPDTRSA